MKAKTMLLLFLVGALMINTFSKAQEETSEDSMSEDSVSEESVSEDSVSEASMSEESAASDGTGTPDGRVVI